MRKVYGQSASNSCVFCTQQALKLNAQKFAVCKLHEQDLVDMDTIKCACGAYLDIKEGKYGAFFLCMHCGPRSVAKIKELYTISPQGKQGSSTKSATTAKTPTPSRASPSPPKEYTITTNDIDYF